MRKWDSFVFWLYRIAFAQCSKWQRAKSRHPDSEFIDDQDPQKMEAPSIDSYRENQMYEWLHESLDSLPEAYREVLTLHYFAGMKSDEIAKALGISPTNIRMRLSRARLQLKEDMLAMMRVTFEQQRLPVTFTFRIIEAIRRIKIQPTSTMKNLPWGLSIATGLIIAIMSFNPNLGQLITFDTLAGAPLPVETKVLKVGEIPVDTVKASQLPIISSEMGKSNGEKPVYQNTLFLAPQAEGGTWVRKADIPIGIGFHSISEVNGKIYVMGGQDKSWNQNLRSFTSVYEYDLKTDTWSKKSDMIIPRSGFATIVVDGKIYAINGWADSDFTNTMEVYDSITDKWEKRADSSTKRAEFAASEVNGKIYVIGGHSGVGPGLTLTEEYDPKTDTWTRKADMPTARTFLASSVVNNKIYVFGGTNDNVASKVLSTVEIYDPSTDTWTKGSDLPTPMALLTSCVINGMIYTMGGCDSTYYNPTTVRIYDSKNDKWLEGKDMPTAEGRISARNYPVLDGKIYAIGGQGLSGLFLSDVWEFIPEGLLSAISSQGKLPKTWGDIKSR